MRAFRTGLTLVIVIVVKYTTYAYAVRYVKQVPPPAVGGEVAAAPIIFFSLYICVLMAVAVTAAVTETVTAAVTVTVAATVLTVSLSLRQS